jgi:hypothetical protein
MRKSIYLLAAAGSLAACGQPAENGAANAGSANAAAAKKPKPAYCFFKDAETKGWAASRDKSGNVVVKGKGYRSDPRYKVVLGEATVTGTTAELSPSIAVNDTGFATPDNWWDVSSTIPNSAGVQKVSVRCGAKTLAELDVPPGR